MLSNAYFLATFRFDTAENEPAKKLQKFRKINFRKCIFEKCIFEKCILRDLEEGGGGFLHQRFGAVPLGGVQGVDQLGGLRERHAHGAFDLLENEHTLYTKDICCRLMAIPGGSVHGERANFTRLLLGCIETKC